MIRYFCFHSSMKEVKVLCLFCPPPVDFTFIHVTFSVFSLNNVVRMLFLDLVTIRRTSWFHLKYLVLLPHTQLEIEVKWTWFRRNIKMVSWRFGPGAGAPSTLDWVLTSSNWSQSVCFWILQNPNCVSESAAASVRWRWSPKRWTWTTLPLKENPLQDTKKKHQAFITKRDFYEFTEHLVELLYPIKPHFMQRSNAQAHIKTTPGPVSASAKSTWAKAARSQINEAFTDSCSAGEKRTRLPFIILIKEKLNVTNNYILSVTDRLRLVWLLHKLLWWN